MLFNTPVFLFAFLPAVLAGFFLLGHFGKKRLALVWLVGASLYFYAFWNVAYIPLLAGSVLFNYGVGLVLSRTPAERPRLRKAVVVLGIVVNLSLLGVFKYTDFALSSVNALAGTSFTLLHIILPLAISFFTFNQIAYLADVYAARAKEYDVLNYAFFVTFFPHLIAGPIVHHGEIMPQLAAISYRFERRGFSVGLTLFVIGLFEKIVLADPLAPYANAVFGASGGTGVGLVWAWTGAIAYSLQLFFDFAGYSTMAIGLARMFGISFPANFNSPYRASSIIDFWRRWHVTLSRFLRNYLYVPLGGNRHGSVRRYVNLFVTMLLGGLWHGAALTFVVWGGLHGAYLAVNHAWEALGRGSSSVGRLQAHGALRVGGYVLTMLAVVVAWVFFRSPDLASALHLCAAMAGAQGMAAVPHDGLPALLRGGPPRTLVLQFAVLAALATLAPNALQLIGAMRSPEDVPAALRWKPNARWGVVVGALAAAAVIFSSQSSTFLYYQF